MQEYLRQKSHNSETVELPKGLPKLPNGITQITQWFWREVIVISLLFVGLGKEICRGTTPFMQLPKLPSFLSANPENT